MPRPLGRNEGPGLALGFIPVIVLGMILFCLPVSAEVLDKIIAVVNDEIITLYEFNEAFNPIRQNIEDTYQGQDKETLLEQARNSFLQRMIDNMLIEQEAKKKGITDSVKEDDVMGALQDMLTKQKMSMQNFLKNLAAEDSSIETVKKEIRSQMIRMRLLRREIKDKIIVTDEEIGEYYNQHRQEYEGKESVRMKQLLLAFPPEADKNVKDKLREEALRLRELLIQGESFDLLTAKHSKGPGAAQGGDVGFMERGTIIPEVEAVALSLPLNQVSEVIESGVGFHIIKVVDKKGAGLKSVSVVREEIKAKLEEEKLEKKFEEWIASVRAKSHIEIKL